MKTSSVTKGVIGIAAAVGLVIAGMNAWTVVSDGTVKVGKWMGKVYPQPLQPGFHFVNPLASFDTYSTRDIKLSWDGVQVPSQDKFKSNVDIAVMIKFDGNKAPFVRVNGGLQPEAIDKYVTTKLMSTVREYGKGVTKAQDLFKPEVQAGLQTSIMQEVNEYSQPYGFTITEVFLQDIDLDPVIKKQITATKEREEQVNQAAATLERVEKEAQQKVKQAEADRQSREQISLAAERDADAKLYAAKKEAEANKALQVTITPEMVKWKQLDVEMIRAQKYQGGVPQTVVGADYNGGLLMDVRK